MTPQKPYLSLVVAARNDNYGGDFTHRIQAFVTVLCGWASRHRLDAELVIVEWNPPADRPSLREQIAWPEDRGSMKVRLIRVPLAIHRTLPNSDRMPLFEYVAKNAGVRRSRGRYVLVTNPDLLYSGELVAWLAAQQLSPDCYYRTDRYDFVGPVPLSPDPEEMVRYAKRHVFVAHFRIDERRGSSKQIGGFRRQLGVYAGLWPSSRRWFDFRTLPAGGALPLEDDTGWFGGIHTNAAGDFILAYRDHWHAVRGFPEFTDTFTHLDGYACHQLNALGLHQRVCLPPAMILHADHSRAEQNTRPRAPVDTWTEDLRKLRAGELGPALNGDGWGLAGHDLREEEF